MGTQQFLTIGGIILFALLTLLFNTSSINQSSSAQFNKAIIIATGLGQGLIEEIHQKAFDENTILEAVDSVSKLTQPYLLNYESGEGYSAIKQKGYDEATTFDDIDDYNGFSRNYPDKSLDNFRADVEVYYINPSNPEIKSNIRTFAKRIDVKITNPYLTIDANDSTGTLILTSIKTY